MNLLKKYRNAKVLIDLPANRIWNELIKHKINLSPDSDVYQTAEKQKYIERLLDKSFQDILNKLIRQN